MTLEGFMEVSKFYIVFQKNRTAFININQVLIIVFFCIKFSYMLSRAIVDFTGVLRKTTLP